MIGIASDGIWGNPQTISAIITGAGNATNTTFAAIRDQLVLIISQLTPNTHSSVGYTFAPRKPIEYAKGTTFRDWAETNDGACYRHYDIVQDGWAPVSAMDPGTQRRGATLELVVAYPEHYRIYGADNSADLYDIMEQDISQLAANIGIRAGDNWVNAATPTLPEEYEYEQGEGVFFAVVTLGFEYYYATS